MLSVIVPVYNKAEYLRKCIDSIISQSYKDIQVVLVDDGSTDGSGVICDQYSFLENVVVFHKDNEGLINARISGLELAKTEYITFVDADDWIERNMYSDLMHLMVDAGSDFVTSGMICEGESTYNLVDGVREGEYCVDKVIDTVEKALWDFKTAGYGILPSLCTKIFKKDLLEKIFSVVDRNITIGEDRAIFYSALSYAKKYVVNHGLYYHYRMIDSSMCHDNSYSDLAQAERLYRYLTDFYKDRGMIDEVRYSLDRNLIDVLDIVESTNIGIKRENYIFPFDIIDKTSKVVIYGVGVVGKSFCKYALATNYVDVVAFVDKYSSLKSVMGVPIYDLTVLLKLSYDVVLIANSNEIIARSIQNELVELGVDVNRIQWVKPVIVE